MATTTPAQPVGTVAAPCRGGLFGWLWSLFGSNTPAYAGTGQPAPGAAWRGWGATTPTYQVAPVEPPAPVESGGDVPAQGSDDGALEAGAIAIVIRRE